MNIWLFVIVQAVASVILTFVLIIGMLVLDMATGMNFVWCFVIGTVLSLPVAWVIYNRIRKS